MRFILIVSAAALLVPSLSVGQGASVPDWPLTPGLRVRVLSAVLGDKQQTGSVVSATSDTLVFLPVKQSASTALSTPNIARIEVVTGTHTNKLKGALLGLFAGAAAGAIYGAASYTPPKCDATTSWCLDIFGRQGNTVAGGVLGSLLGILTGTIVGSRESDTWVPVAVPAR
jgi:hypothetical protein